MKAWDVIVIMTGHYCKKQIPVRWTIYLCRAVSLRIAVYMRIFCIRLLERLGIKEITKKLLVRVHSVKKG